MIVVLVDAAQLITALRLVLHFGDPPRIKGDPHRIVPVVHSVLFLWLSWQAVPTLRSSQGHRRVSHHLFFLSENRCHCLRCIFIIHALLFVSARTAPMLVQGQLTDLGVFQHPASLLIKIYIKEI